jgi:hypothetical protein
VPGSRPDGSRVERKFSWLELQVQIISHTCEGKLIFCLLHYFFCHQKP